MLRVLELFAGIGAASKALERLKIPHEIADCVEIDKYAVASFNAIHGTDFEPQDITEWDKDIECDLIVHGSPCTDFSIAGLQAGGDKGSGTRSSLMYESTRIIEKLKPKYVIWENVKNLLSKKHRHNFDAYLEAMEGLGYENFYRVLNARDYGVPQNRERLFTISILGGGEFEFPEKQSLTKRLKDILEENVDKKYYIRNYESLTKVNESFSVIEGGPIGKMHDISRRVYNTDGISPSVCTRSGGNTEPKICEPLRIKTVTTNGMGVIENYRIRKLTPRSCWRLMGFDDADFEKAEKVNSDTQLYHQAGNSIVVDVLMAILKELFKWQ